jgi:hypothetical protein
MKLNKGASALAIAAIVASVAKTAVGAVAPSPGQYVAQTTNFGYDFEQRCFGDIPPTSYNRVIIPAELRYGGPNNITITIHFQNLNFSPNPLAVRGEISVHTLTITHGLGTTSISGDLTRIYYNHPNRSHPAGVHRVTGRFNAEYTYVDADSFAMNLTENYTRDQQVCTVSTALSLVRTGK